MTSDDMDPMGHDAHPEGEATRGEREANPPPPTEEPMTAEDVHDTPQLPPESHRRDDHDDE